jgi:hypothetical protein
MWILPTIVALNNIGNFGEDLIDKWGRICVLKSFRRFKLELKFPDSFSSTSWGISTIER